MAALISSVMNTKDQVPFYVAACDEMGIEVLPPDVNVSAARLRGRRGQDPLRPERGQERRESAVARDRRRARGGRAVHVDLGLLRARRPAGREQARARGARQVRRARLDGGVAEGDARRARGRALLRAGATRRTGSPARARSSTSAARSRAGGRATTRRSRARSSRKRSSSRSRRRVSASTSPSIRSTASRRPAAPQDRLPLAEVERRRDGEVVTVGGIVGALKQLTTKKGDPMVFLRLDDLSGSRRDGRLQLGLRGRARAARGRPRPRRQGPGRPQGGRDEADRARGRPVRGDAGRGRGAAARRRAPGAGGHRSASSRRSCASSRASRGPRGARDVGGPQTLCVRPGVPRPARAGLLRRGEGAPRRGCDRARRGRSRCAQRPHGRGTRRAGAGGGARAAPRPPARRRGPRGPAGCGAHGIRPPRPDADP